MTPEIDKAFAQRIVDFCLGPPAQPGGPDPIKDFEQAFTQWDGAAELTNKYGLPGAVSRAADGSFSSNISHTRYVRVVRTLTEITGLGFRPALRIDMHDAREYGLEGTRLKKPVLVYNRRRGAQNMVLWPLTNYHTIGERRFVHPVPLDPIPFAQKTDIAVWRGALSGRPNIALAPDSTWRRFGAEILADLNQPQTEEALWALHQELMGITRYNLVLRYHLSKNMDVGLTLKDAFTAAKETSLLAPLCKNRTGIDWFFRSKYILSLTGNDTGSNFLPAANSNSVVLKEEDGWELFYSGEFRPWEHYIPMRLGALDVEEKLAWAKDNPKACTDMVRAAQAVCAKLASPETRRLYLSEILSHLA